MPNLGDESPGITFFKNANRQGQSQYFGAGDYMDLSLTGFPFAVFTPLLGKPIDKYHDGSAFNP